jgi:hypothetical protein
MLNLEYYVKVLEKYGQLFYSHLLVIMLSLVYATLSSVIMCQPVASKFIIIDSVVMILCKTASIAGRVSARILTHHSEHMTRSKQ